MASSSSSAAPLSERVARLLTGEEQDLTGLLPALQVSRLGGAVWKRLAPTHPQREQVRGTYLANTAHHARIRHELRPLLAEWARRGIPFVLLKGFGLAEFDYPTPGERFYGDVDVLIPDDPELVWRAVQLAVAFGWSNDELHLHQGSWVHETAHLSSPGGEVRIDLHRFPVSSLAPAAKVQALTAGLWSRAKEHDWDGIPTFRPDPRDAVVVGLCLNRCWGGDWGRLKPNDYLDFELLAGKGLTLEELNRHAERLGVERTWQAFVSLCNPFAPHLVLNPEVTRLVLLPAVTADGAYRRLRTRTRLRRRLGQGWSALPVLPAALGDVAAAWCALRQVSKGSEPRQPLASWPAGQERRLRPGELAPVLRVIRLLTLLLYPRLSRRGACVPRAYASYHALRRLGHPVVFVNGVQRTQGQIRGHAWIEDDRGPIAAYGEADNRRQFKVLFEYPAPAARPRR